MRNTGTNFRCEKLSSISFTILNLGVKMDLILNPIIIVLNTFLIAIVPVGRGSGHFKSKVLCLLHRSTAQLNLSIVGFFLKHRRNN